MGPFFSVRLSERRGSWLEMLLYHRSLCGTLRNIWTAVRGIIIVFFWPSDETGMRFLICCFWVFLFNCYLQSSHQASRWIVHLADNGLKTACIKGDTWRHSAVKDLFKSVSKHCHISLLTLAGCICTCKNINHQQFWLYFTGVTHGEHGFQRSCWNSHFITIPLIKGLHTHSIDSCNQDVCTDAGFRSLCSAQHWCSPSIFIKRVDLEKLTCETTEQFNAWFQRAVAFLHPVSAVFWMYLGFTSGNGWYLSSGLITYSAH